MQVCVWECMVLMLGTSAKGAVICVCVCVCVCVRARAAIAGHPTERHVPSCAVGEHGACDGDKC